ncbi:MAG: isopentenyl phosphate kinase [Thermoproteota archaeon]|nr:isopentenyl phosphate kinase [Thermoproteota archaeon]
MAGNDDLIVIKLGGSVITYKNQPLAPNLEAIENIAKTIKDMIENHRVLIVHGGGSFGHYWSVKYDMHTKPMPYPSEGISIVHESMIKLNHIVVEKFLSNGLKPFSIPPSNYVFNNLPCKDRISDLISMTRNNDLIPVTYGDVIHTSSGNFSILSGDTIMNLLSTSLKPQLSVFTTSVDGIYDRLGDDGNLIPSILVGNGDVLSHDPTIDNERMSFDVTGGMKRKMAESIKIVKEGIPVYLINGFQPERLLDIINNRNFVGTCIRKG